MSLKKKIFNFLTALVVVFGSAPFSFVGSVYADEGDLPEPITKKELSDNGDGTYKITLSVTGRASSSQNNTKANIVVVYDTSGSMKYPEPSTQYGVYGYNITDGYTINANNYVDLYYCGRTDNNGYGRDCRRVGANDNHDSVFYPYDYYGTTYYLPYSGPRYDNKNATQTRASVAESALKSLGSKLLNYNTTTGISDMVQIAFVDFATNVNSSTTHTNTPTTNSTTFSSWVEAAKPKNGNDGGTNWEAALTSANSVNFGDSDPTYIVFVSDGNPTFRTSSHSQGSYHDNACGRTLNSDDKTSSGWTCNEPTGVHGSGNSDPNGWNLSDAQTVAASIVNGGKTLYSVGVFGDATNMQNLNSSAIYKDATNQTQLEAAFNDIVKAITNSLSLTGVTFTDGITGMTEAAIDGKAGDFTYTKGGSVWTDAPAATYDESTKTVQWKLGNTVLNDGETASVSFNVYPSQDSIDLVADLNNDKQTYEDLTDAQKAQIVQNGNAYTLKTNTDSPKLKYKVIQTQTVNGVTTTTTSSEKEITIENPPAVSLPTDKISLEKKWEDSLDLSQREEICENVEVESDEAGQTNTVKKCEVVLDLYKDGVKYNDEPIHITDATEWVLENYISVAPGLLVAEGHSSYDETKHQIVTFDGTKYAILREGHDYYFEEHDINSHYQLTNYRYHPMEILYNGELRLMNVKFVKDNDGKITAIEEISEMTSISATNTIKGGINISKKVIDEDGNQVIDSKDNFDVKIHLINADGSDFAYDYRIYTYADGTQSGNYVSRTGHICSTGSENENCSKTTGKAGLIEETITVNDVIRVVNVPTGVMYYVGENDIPKGYSLDNIDYKIKYGADGVETADAVAKTVDDKNYYAVKGNSASSAVVTNKYVSGNLEISKVVEVGAGANKNQAKAREFDFTLNLYADGTKATEILTPYAIEGREDTFVSGDTFTLKDGDSIKLLKLPEGAYYEVTESKASGYATTSTGDTGTIVKNTTSEADFTNTYSVDSTSTQAKVSKAFGNYWDLTKINGFEFVLTPIRTSTGTYPSTTSRNTTATSVLPASWTFNITGEGTWVYEISEAEYNHPGVSPLTDNEVVTLTITSVDNGDGTLAVTKSYSKNSVSVAEENATIDNTYKTLNTVSETIKVKKTIVDDVTGEHDATFEFELKNSAGTVIDTATVSTNKLSGQGSFKTLTFDKAGIYTYTVSEKDERRSEDGWTYDDTVYTVTIDVKEDYTTALLSATMTIEGKETDTVEFANKYEVEPTSATVTVKKAFDNFWYEGDSFNFIISSKNGDSFTQTKSVDEFNQTATFTLSFDAPGDYEYTVTENTQFTRPGISQVTSNPITVRINVKDNNDGTLAATITQGAASIIENTYETTPTSAKLNVKKTIDDQSNSRKDGSFTFDLKKADGSVEDTVTISTRNLKGEDSFGTLEFTEEGTYTYTIVERDGGEAGFAYDTTPRVVEIAVKDNKDKAELYIESIKIDGEDVNLATVEIENVYQAEKTSIELSATKELTGREWLDSDEFSFTLTGEGISSQTETATKDKKTVAFESIEYTEVGTYEYTISEEEANLPAGVENKTGEISVVVTVEDIDGKLVATAEYSDEATIINEYAAAPTEAVVVKLQKVINDVSGDAEDGTFKFRIENNGNGEVSYVEITTEELVGETEIFDLEFDEEGTYELYVKEVNDGKEYFEYDVKEHYILVVVEDNREGQLIATVYVDDEENDTLVITNNFNKVDGKGVVEEPEEEVVTPNTGRITAEKSGAVETSIVAVVAIVAMLGFGIVMIRRHASLKLEKNYDIISRNEQEIQREQASELRARKMLGRRDSQNCVQDARGSGGGGKSCRTRS